MLKRSIVLLILVMVPFGCLAGEPSPWDIKLPFEKATIEYSLSGVEQGSETIYIRDWGRETAKFHSSAMNMMGMSKPSETVEFVDPEYIYTFNLLERTGTKMVNPQKYMKEEYGKLSDSEKEQVRKNSKEMAMGPIIGGMSGTVEKNAEEILGYSCDKVNMMSSTMYFIHGTGLPLKTESHIMGMINLTEATNIDTTSSPDKNFLHPEGITPIMDEEADAMARSVAKETIATLKDPEAAERAKNRSVPGIQQQQLTPEEQQEMEKAMEALKEIFGN